MTPHDILMGCYIAALPYTDAVLSDEQGYDNTEDDDTEEYNEL